ncbi:HD domain-containing protein [Rickettsia endosymbiont of Halotydeus destructor]|uniref:HD domain-containing protein n=1 Tax=Rickettsia endosymbiont of Halotydeus destructor TaxID=2996754 RepID=UPI003BB09AEC
MQDINCWEEKFEICEYATKLLDKITSLNKLVKQPVDIREIKKGIYYARKYHGTQMRQSGEPYYSHPIEVAYLLAEYTATKVPELFIPSMLNAALLHDTVEDTPLTEEDVTKIFDKDTARHVEGLTRVKPSGKISAEESLILLFKQKRNETILIKMFDRIHNLYTIGVKSPEKTKKIIEETLRTFLVLAVYLKLTTIEQEFIRINKSLLQKYAPKPQPTIPYGDNSQLLSLVF